MRYVKHTMSIAERQKLEVAAMNAEAVNATTSIGFVKMAEEGILDEVTAGEHMSLFAPWGPNITYVRGNLRTYTTDDGVTKLYRCIQTHTSQEDKTPDTTKGLWTVIYDPTIEYPDWSQPIGVSDAYQLGDKVTHKGKHWVSTVNDNQWEPGVRGWEM